MTKDDDDGKEAPFPYLQSIKVHFAKMTGGGTKSYFSDGSRHNLRVAAVIEQTLSESPANAEISLYNLSDDTRSSFIRNETEVTIEAGWKNTGMALVFKGELLQATSQRAGPDIITSVYAMTKHYGVISTTANRTWGPNVPVTRIITDLVKEMPGVPVGSIKDINGRVGLRGYSVSGTIPHILSGLAREFGFSWRIAATGEFVAIGDNEALSSGPTLGDPYLISATPALSSAQQWRTGINAVALFTPTLQPGQIFRIRSSVDKRNDGNYMALRVRHDLDAFAMNSFTTSVEGFVESAKAY